MKCPAIILACIMTIGINANASEDTLVDLGDLQWKQRIILVFAREPLVSNALSKLRGFEAEMKERDIAWFVLDDDSLDTNYDGPWEDKLHKQLMDRYFTPVPSETVVILIGKDGSIKSRSADLDLETTFGLIDQMPMRRQEMRRQRDNSD